MDKHKWLQPQEKAALKAVLKKYERLKKNFDSLENIRPDSARQRRCKKQNQKIHYHNLKRREYFF